MNEMSPSDGIPAEAAGDNFGAPMGAEGGRRSGD
jgi:hypothetical protein